MLLIIRKLSGRPSFWIMPYFQYHKAMWNMELDHHSESSLFPISESDLTWIWTIILNHACFQYQKDIWHGVRQSFWIILVSNVRKLSDMELGNHTESCLIPMSESDLTWIWTIILNHACFQNQKDIWHGVRQSFWIILVSNIRKLSDIWAWAIILNHALFPISLSYLTVMGLVS